MRDIEPESAARGLSDSDADLAEYVVIDGERDAAMLRDQVQRLAQERAALENQLESQRGEVRRLTIAHAEQKRAIAAQRVFDAEDAEDAERVRDMARACAREAARDAARRAAESRSRAVVRAWLQAPPPPSRRASGAEPKVLYGNPARWRR